MTRKTPLIDTLSGRRARFQRAVERRPLLRFLGGRGAMAVLLGSALSVGGIADGMDQVQFLVTKDLDAVRVVRRTQGDDKVVARVEGEYAGNALFKFVQIFPERFVSRELALFDLTWLGGGAGKDAPDGGERDVFYEEMRRINEAVRAEFFAEEIPYGVLIHEKAKKYDVDPALVAAVIEQESRFKPRAKSPVGARGLMQLMPRTGRWMGAKNLYDPEENVDAGVKYIRYLNKQFKGDLRKTIAAYNAGEGNVRRYRGIPPFRETRQYVNKVLTNYDRRTRQLEEFRRDQAGGSIPEQDGSLALR